MIEPHRLPTRRLERQFHFELGGCRSLARLHQAFGVADLHIEPVRILDVEALESLAVVVGYRIEIALAEFRLDGLGVPRLDGEAETVHQCRRLFRRRGLEDRRAPVADVENGLLAVVAAQLPTHQGDVERRFLAVVRHLERDVFQGDGLPAGGREQRLDGSRCHLLGHRAVRCVVAILAAALSKQGRGEGCAGSRGSQGAQHIAAGSQI